jgi:hypothetical protein
MRPAWQRRSDAGEETTMEISRRDGWTRRRFGLAASVFLPAVLGIARGQEAAAKRKKPAGHAIATFKPVGGSGVSGFATLHQRKEGTQIEIFATGLTPGDDSISIYYDNGSCTLEEDSIPDDVVGGAPYTANAAGIGHTHGEADDDLDEIGSVSVRRNDANHTLLACAHLTT